MSDLGISPVHNLATGQTASLDQDEKYVDEKQIDEQIEIFQADLPQIDVGVPAAPPNDTVRGEWRRKIVQQYGRYAEAEGIAPAADITAILDRVAAMTEEDAMTIVLHAIETHGNDLNFPEPTMQKLKLLVQGYKIALMDPAEWEFDLKCEAAILRYHSPYPEVRSVTEPFDDPTLPVETIRSYVLGVCLMAGTTALNSFFSPRQPSISISGLVLQCLLAPLGQAWAKVMPDWGVTVFGTRHSLNPGPWTFKEQVFAALIFTIGNGAGATYYTYLVQVSRHTTPTPLSLRGSLTDGLSDDAAIPRSDLGFLWVRVSPGGVRPDGWVRLCRSFEALRRLSRSLHLAELSPEPRTQQGPHLTAKGGRSRPWVANVSLQILYDRFRGHVRVVLGTEYLLHRPAVSTIELESSSQD